MTVGSGGSRINYHILLSHGITSLFYVDSKFATLKDICDHQLKGTHAGKRNLTGAGIFAIRYEYPSSGQEYKKGRYREGGRADELASSPPPWGFDQPYGDYTVHRH